MGRTVKTREGQDEVCLLREIIVPVEDLWNDVGGAKLRATDNSCIWLLPPLSHLLVGIGPPLGQSEVADICMIFYACFSHYYSPRSSSQGQKRVMDATGGDEGVTAWEMKDRGNFCFKGAPRRAIQVPILVLPGVHVYLSDRRLPCVCEAGGYIWGPWDSILYNLSWE